MRTVALATEDELSEAVGRRLAIEAGLTVTLTLRRNGNGYLKSNMQKWCDLARPGHPVILLTDLDRGACAPELVAAWSGRRVLPQELVFRIAVREVEAWLLADHEGMGKLLRKSASLPDAPELLAHPKEELLKLAKRAPRAVRNDLVAESGSVARQGLGYNHRLCEFVRESWSPARAAQRSPSLNKARERIGSLTGK